MKMLLLKVLSCLLTTSSVCCVCVIPPCDDGSSTVVASTAALTTAASSIVTKTTVTVSVATSVTAEKSSVSSTVTTVVTEKITTVSLSTTVVNVTTGATSEPVQTKAFPYNIVGSAVSGVLALALLVSGGWLAFRFRVRRRNTTLEISIPYGFDSFREDVLFDQGGMELGGLNESLSRGGYRGCDTQGAV